MSTRLSQFRSLNEIESNKVHLRSGIFDDVSMDTSALKILAQVIDQYFGLSNSKKKGEKIMEIAQQKNKVLPKVLNCSIRN